MDVIARRAIELGITEQAVDALVNDQGRPLMERVCEFAEGVIANNQRGAVDRIAELEADLERERLARRMVDQALRDALARADRPQGGQ